MTQHGFSGKRTAEIVDITYRQLDYWTRTELVRPSMAEAAGSGSRRLYSYQDLLELKVVKALLDAGIRLEQVRKVFAYMRNSLGEDVASANLVIDGSKSVLVHTGEELIDLLQNGHLSAASVKALMSLEDLSDLMGLPAWNAIEAAAQK